MISGTQVLRPYLHNSTCCWEMTPVTSQPARTFIRLFWYVTPLRIFIDILIFIFWDLLYFCLSEWFLLRNMIVFDSNHWVNVKHIETTDLGQHTGKRKYDSANFLGIFNVYAQLKRELLFQGKLIHLWKKNISAENIFFLEGLRNILTTTTYRRLFYMT